MKHLMDQVLISVEREDDGLVGREQQVEGIIAHAVGVIFRLKEGHEIDHVYNPYAKLRGEPSEPPGSRDNLQSRCVASACQYHVWTAIRTRLRLRDTHFVSRPVPH